ncbi:MAG: type II toxin-antitoxin system HicA family toxin [Gammaproteobacteria bacterium]|nr:type II toxin-antitoxin system HicA family toxin [Gammaproteobacteria bacterium]
MIDCLQRLGFEVREGKKSGHRVFVHHGIQAFRSGAFTCGHGKNPEIKPAYVTQIIRLIRRYESEFIELLEQDHDH